MTKPRRRFELPPRVLKVVDTAEYLGHSLTWFCKRRGELEALGFPKPLPYFEGYDRRAIDDWLDRQGDFSQDKKNFNSAWEIASNG
jgi:hypothetical protein